MSLSKDLWGGEGFLHESSEMLHSVQYDRTNSAEYARIYRVHNDLETVSYSLNPSIDQDLTVDGWKRGQFCSSMNGNSD